MDSSSSLVTVPTEGRPKSVLLTRQMLTGHSRFRHVFGSPATRDRCYEGIRVALGTAHDASLCAVNSLYLAVIVECTGGGVFVVLPLGKTGRLDGQYPRVCGHSAPLTDIKWNPFNDHVIASASDDATIKIWTIPEGALHFTGGDNLTDWSVELSGHSRRVSHCQWHPTASDILLSAGYDFKCIVWNTKAATAANVISVHGDILFSISWNRNGSLFATTCKDGHIRVVEPRSGTVVAMGRGHEGTAKASRVVFIGDQNRIVTTGFSRAGQRQYALWDTRDLSQPLILEDVDSSSSILMPFYDFDTRVLYLAGKGDCTIRYYEVMNSAPYFRHLNQFQSPIPHRDLAMMPKLGVDPTQCEIARFYRLHAGRDVCEPVSMILPRKTEIFQPDIFPPTASSQPALTAEEWLNGTDREPILVSFKDLPTAINNAQFFARQQKPARVVRPSPAAATKTSQQQQQQQQQDVVSASTPPIELRQQQQQPPPSPVTTASLCQDISANHDDNDVDVTETGFVPTVSGSGVSSMISQFEQYVASSPPTDTAERRAPAPTAAWQQQRRPAAAAEHQPKMPRLASSDTSTGLDAAKPTATSDDQMLRKQPETVNADRKPSDEMRREQAQQQQRQPGAPVAVGRNAAATGDVVPATCSGREKTKMAWAGGGSVDSTGGVLSTDRRNMWTHQPPERRVRTMETDDDVTGTYGMAATGGEQDCRNPFISYISTDAPDDTVVKPSALRSERSAGGGGANQQTKTGLPKESPTAGRLQDKRQRLDDHAWDVVDSAATDSSGRKRSAAQQASQPETINGDAGIDSPVDHRDLLEKYFQQLEVIKTLKEQLAYKDKKIRRLEDQLRYLGRAGSVRTNNEFPNSATSMT